MRTYSTRSQLSLDNCRENRILLKLKPVNESGDGTFILFGNQELVPSVKGIVPSAFLHLPPGLDKDLFLNIMFSHKSDLAKIRMIYGSTNSDV